MFQIVLQTTLLLLLPLHSSSVVSYGSQNLWKPYTLKVPVLLPIGGPIAPLGKMCTEPIELFLSIVNNRSDILPDYNIVYDVIDDQCRDTVAISNILPFFLSGSRAVDLASPETNIGQYFLPANKTFADEKATTGYIPPFLIGGMCSGVCKVVARYVSLFNIINFSAACNSGVLSNRNIYRNLYRIMAETQIADAFVSLSKMMNWNKVGIISDTGLVSFMITNQTIALFGKTNITVVLAEFYTDDPTDAVARIKESGVRVIIVNCYYDTCPALACEAYRQHLYGPRIIWVFPGSTDFVNTDLPNNCTKEMVQKIDFGALFMRQIAPDYKSTPIEVGLTGQDLDTFLEGIVPNLWKDKFVDSRWMCFDSVAPSAFILDSVERKLNARGSSLRHYIQDPLKRAELSEMIRQATTSIDIRIFSGRIRYQPGEQEILVPNGWEQSQKDYVRELVTMDRGVDAVDEASRFEFKAPFMWLTKDGKAPKVERTQVTQLKGVPTWVGSILSAIAFSLILLAVFILLFQLFLRKDVRIAYTYPVMSNVALTGMTFLLAIIIILPASGDMKTFCRVAPPMAIFGYSLLNGAIVLKIAHKYLPPPLTLRNKGASNNPSNLKALPSKSIQLGVRPASVAPTIASNIRTFRNGRNILQRNAVFVGFVSWVLVNVILWILWYVLGGLPTTRSIIFSRDDDEADVVWHDIWETCTTNSKKDDEPLYLQTFAGSIMVLQGICLLAAMLLAVMKRQNVAVELKRAVFSIYVLFPATVAEVLVVSMADTADVIYYFLSVIVILKCLAVMYLLFGTKTKLYHGVMKDHISSLRTAVSTRQYRPSTSLAAN